MPIPSYILPSAPAYTEDSVYALIPTPSTPIYTPDAISFTRGSDATRTASNGLIQRVPWNLYQQSNTFNVTWIKAGVTSSITANSGISPDGTNNAWYYSAIGGVKNLRQDISLVANNVYTVSIWVKSYGLGNNTFRLGDGGSASTLTTVTATSDWQRVTCTFTSATTGSRSIGIFQVTSENPIDVLLYGAQLVEGSSAQTYFPTTDRLNVPRLSYMYGSCPALLLEPQRTNSIRNSTMVGAVTGSPGTLPTNYGEVLQGLSREIVGIGTENGLSYIDFKISGTATGTIASLRYEGGTNIAASNGQNWSQSVYLKVISGTVNAVRSAIIERTSVGSYVDERVSSDFSLSTTLNRYTYTATLSGGVTTAYIQPSLYFTLTIGQSYNFTIRIAQPQCELGSYATTPIPTTTASATRIADSFSRNNIYTNGLITSSGGTWFVELRGNVSYTRDAFSNGLQLADNNTSGSISGNGFIVRRNDLSQGRVNIQKVIAGVPTALFQTITDTVKFAIKWNGSTADVFVNGTKEVSATAFTTTNMEFLLGYATDVPKFIQAMALYPTPLSDAALITMTT
jgi:hypothetical protein